MNKLQKHIYTTHRIYFTAMFQSRFPQDRRSQFADDVHREMFMFFSAENGINAPYPPVCFGIAP